MSLTLHDTQRKIAICVTYSV